MSLLPTVLDASPLAFTLAPLVADTSGSSMKEALDRSKSTGLQWVQISATMPGLRPRDLDRAARRDVLATLRRRELNLAGLDAWIPADHFVESSTADRAVTAMMDVISLAGDLGRVPVSLVMPDSQEVVAALVDAAERAGVTLIDHGCHTVAQAGTGIGIDPAACLATGCDPSKAVHSAAASLMSARLVDLLRTGMRGPPGSASDGRLDVQSYKIALSVNDYRRPIIIDARQWFDPLLGIMQAIRVWQQA